MSDPLFDGTGAGKDPTRDGEATELAKLEAKLGVFAHDAPLRELPARRAPARRWPIASLGACVAAAAVLFVWLGGRHEHGSHHGGGAAGAPCSGSTGFAFAVTNGDATCGGAAVASAGTLPVGAWLETHDHAVAAVKIADIGELTVFGDSKLRLVATGPATQHLELARGHVHAQVTAPPRLFVVDTPAASAVDLGCQYDLVVDARGTHLRVTVGAVSLEDKRGVVYVPATFEVDMVPGHLGTPISIDATTELRDAVSSFDRGGPVAPLVAAAASRDRVTLWNAIAHTTGTDRAALVAKLEDLAPLPDPTLHAKVLAGDADALDIWLDIFVDRGNLAHDQKRGPKVVTVPRRSSDHANFPTTS